MYFIEAGCREPTVIDRLISEFLFGLAAMDCGVHGETRPRSPSGRIKARHLALYLAHVGINLTQKRVAAMFGLDAGTVGYACRLVEDRRDDPAFDDRVAALEACLERTPLPEIQPDA